jgi:hypothetical protein
MPVAKQQFDLGRGDAMPRNSQGTIALISLIVLATWLLLGLPLLYAGSDVKNFFVEWLIKFLVDIKITDVLLAAFTGFLAVYTARLWTATRALSEADRPHLVPAVFSISNMRSDPDETGRIKLLFTYRMENHGKSPAFVKKACLMTWEGDTIDELPETPPYGTVPGTNRIISPQGWYGSAVAAEILVSADSVARILERQKIFINFGFIEYEDFSRNKFKIRFAFTYEFGPAGASTMFVPTGPDSYWEYT